MLKAFYRLLGGLMAAGLTALMIGAIVIVGVMAHYSRDLPDYGQLASYEPKTVTRLYTSDGKLLAEYAIEKRIFVPLSAIPKRIQQAFIAAEDQNFYEHGGIDFTAIMRAAFINIVNFGKGKSLVGGSTITQQLVKNFLLTNEQSLERKIKEAILSFRISEVYSKSRILELYLNEIYLGNGSYGVAAAALNYFNKSLDELSTEEAAFLAALPKAPASYHPDQHYDRAKERRDWVISRMLEDGYLTAEEASEAVSAPITTAKRDKAEIAHADFFAEEVRRQLVDMYGANVLYEGGLYVKTTLDPVLQEYADESLREALIDYDRRWGWRGPLSHLDSLGEWNKEIQKLEARVPVFPGQSLAVVRAAGKDKAEITLADGRKGVIALGDIKWARKQLGILKRGDEVKSVAQVLSKGDIILVKMKGAEEKKGESDEKAQAGKIVACELMQIPQVNGALIAIDPHTGRVLAMAGGYSAMNTEFNRATQARRQPGSAFKPFVYLASLENGFSPATIVVDSPVTLTQGDGLPNWSPQNYGHDYLGAVPLRVGLEKSRNAMTVRLAQALGIERVKEIGERFGIYDQAPNHFAVVLGAVETTLIRLTNAYAMLVNGGKEVRPWLIERIDDRNGKAIFRRDGRECKSCTVTPAAFDAASAPNAPKLNDDRRLVVDPRVAYQMVSMLQGVVERGTATKAKEIGKPLAGKTGTTNDSRDTWFVGFSPDLVVGTYVGFDSPRTMGRKETGASVALPGFIHFMKSVLADRPSTPFRIPPGISMVKIDRMTGQAPGFDTPPNNVILEAFLSGQPLGGEAALTGDGSLPWRDDAIGAHYEAGEEWRTQRAAPGGVFRDESGQWIPRHDGNRDAYMERRQAGEGYSGNTEYQAPPLRPAVSSRKRPAENPPIGRGDNDVGTGGLY